MGKKRKNIKSIFSEALEKRTAKERAAYLDRVCGDDLDLRAEFESLLKEHDAAGSFLGSPALAPDAAFEESPIIEGPGTRIGRYELLEMLGEGGMGLVYLAEQKEPVRRQVALKIMKPGMDSKQVITRFEAERQVLALLDHPNIARVFDAGTTETGRLYFVMEYVKGMSITRYCDREKLGIENRLKLFSQVCYAVQHAHQKGIIHRDIKPSNILVSVQDDRAVPKIIDFGIAKAVTQPLTEHTLYTKHGQLLGTPEYMSPEQTDIGNRDIDIRADIYSLGVVLYELLTGVLPFEHKALEKVGFAELQRILQEEEPPRLSLRFTALGEEAKEIAERRHTQVVALARRLHRELEWIPLKAMRKDRSRRYRSASEFADDIRNYLDGAPLIAGPETVVYRVKKFVQKHAGSVATAVLVAALIVLGLVVSSAMYLRAEKALQKEAVARGVAEKARGIAEQAEKVAEERGEEYRHLSYVHGVALADTKYRERNIHSTRTLLEACPEDLRNWEWYRLNYVLDESLITIAPSQVGVFSIAVSPNGNRIVSSSILGEYIKIWDAESGAEILAFKGHGKGRTGPLAFNADGKRIVSGGFDHMVKIWDASTGEELMTFEGHEGRVHCVAFNPDGKRIVSGSFDHTLKIWDTLTGQELRTLSGHKDLVICVAFSPDGRQIASGGYDQTVRIWDTVTGEQLKVFHIDGQKVVTVDYSPDGKRIAIGCGPGLIRILDTETGQGITAAVDHVWYRSTVTSVAFNPDGTRLVSGSYDQTVRIWNADTGEEITTLVGHPHIVSKVAFTPDGKRIVSAGAVGGIKIWDANPNGKGKILSGHEQLVHQLVFTADGERLVSCSRDNTIKVWDVSGAREIRTLRGHDGAVVKVAISPDGKRIVSGSIDKTLRIWDADTGQELRKLTGHDGPVYSVAISPDGKRIASGGVKDVKVWDASTGEELMVLHGHKVKGAIHSVAFSPNGKRIVSAGSDTTIRIWNADTGKELRTLSGHKMLVCNALFTPNGERIVSGAYDGKVKVWDSVTGNQLMSLFGHKESHIESLAISPDGTRIVSGSFAETKLWDVATGTELMMISADHAMYALAFSPDGKTIAGAGDDKEIILWETAEKLKNQSSDLASLEEAETGED